MKWNEMEWNGMKRNEMEWSSWVVVIQSLVSLPYKVIVIHGSIFFGKIKLSQNKSYTK